MNYLKLILYIATAVSFGCFAYTHFTDGATNDQIFYATITIILLIQEGQIDD